jgi:hypothetical protein
MKPLSKFQILLVTAIALIAGSTVDSFAERGPNSALRFREKKQLPSQVLDLSTYDDVIELDCRELKDYLTYPGTKITPIVKVSAWCRCDTKNNSEAPRTKYEDLLFGQDKAIGSKRFASIPIRERDQIAIFVKTNGDNLSEAEAVACANALIRLRLELGLNRNSILTVRIPHQSIQTMIAALREKNFRPYRECSQRISVLISIPLETDLGAREMMCYAPT